MINTFPSLCEFGAITCGAGIFARLALKRPASIPQLVERVDMELARDICSLAENRFSEASWMQLCTAGAMWHMLAQARLLTKIVIEIRKDTPGANLTEPAIPLRAMLKGIRVAGLLSLLEVWGHVPPIHAHGFLKGFAKTFYLVENAIVVSGN